MTLENSAKTNNAVSRAVAAPYAAFARPGYVGVTLPLKVVSNANQREHWAKRANRAKAHRSTARLAISGALLKAGLSGSSLPSSVTVQLVRIAPRALDDDNLVGGFKAIRDGIADAMGIDDRDSRVTWLCGQRKGSPKEYLVEIAVWSPIVTSGTET